MSAVTVTAQKREEDLQRVPLSDQVIEGPALEAEGIRSIGDLQLVVPSLQFTETAGFPLVFLRGVGTDNFVPSAEPSVATYVDGIYVPISASGLASLEDVKNVEVIKGPQGTLFGRNATGGVISITTQDPGRRTRFKVGAEVGERGDRVGKLSLSSPITSWLSFGVWAVHSRVGSDYTDTRFAVAPDVFTAVRGKLKMRFDEVTWTLSAYRALPKGTDNLVAKNVAPSPLGKLAGVPQQADDYQANNDYPGLNKSRQQVYSSNLTWRAPGVDVRLLAGYERLETYYSSTDFDGSPNPAAALNTTNTFVHDTTGELQFVSNEEGPWSDAWKWTAGVYALQGRSGIDPGFLFLSPGTLTGFAATLGNPGLVDLATRIQNLVDNLGLSDTPLGTNGLGLGFRGVIDTNSLAGYAETTVKPTDWLDVTLGGRYQHERRALIVSETDLANPNGDGTTTLMESNKPGRIAETFSPRGILGFHVLDNLYSYASYSVAYKSGTYNIVNLFTQPSYIPPEKAAAVEFGTKWEAFQHRVRVNAAVFDNQLKNLQSGFVSLFSAGAVSFVSVPHARSRGAEIESSWLILPTRNPLLVSLSGTYLDSRYTDFPNGPGFDPTTGLYNPNLNLTGKRMVYTPRWVTGLGFTQGLSAGRAVFELAADAHFNAGFYTDANNTNREPSFTVVNLRLGVRDQPTGIDFAIFCKNALDERYHSVNVITDFGAIHVLAPSRLIGARVSVPIVR